MSFHFRDCAKTQYLSFLRKRLCKKPIFVIPAKETVPETLARHALHAETLAGLAILLGSCFRGCAKTLVRLRWWKTQPPKSPLSGGLSTQFPPYQGDFPLNSPPYQGDFPLNSPLIRGTFHSIPPLIRGTFHSIPPLSGGLSTQFPPLSGGLSTQFPPYQGDFPLNSPPYQGDFPLNSPLIRGTFHSIPPLIRGTFHSIPPLIRGARGVKNDERWVSGTVSLWRIVSLCHWRAEQVRKVLSNALDSLIIRSSVGVY